MGKTLDNFQPQHYTGVVEQGVEIPLQIVQFVVGRARGNDHRAQDKNPRNMGFSREFYPQPFEVEFQPPVEQSQAGV